MKKTMVMLCAATALAACGGAAEEEAAEGETAEAVEEEAAPEHSFLPHGAPLFPGADESTAEEHAVFRDSYEYRSDAAKLEIAQFYGDYIAQSDIMRVISAGVRTTSGQSIGINGTIVNAYRADDESFNADLTTGITATIPIHPDARPDTINAYDDVNTPYVSYRVDESVSSMDLLAFYHDAFSGQEIEIREVRVVGQGDNYRPNLEATIRDAMGGGHSVVVKATGFTAEGELADE